MINHLAYYIIHTSCFGIGGIKMVVNYKRILVGMDGSDNSELALQRAIDIAVTNDANLYIAHIIDIRTLSNYAALDFDYSNLINDDTVRSLNEYKEQAESQGVKHVEAVIEYGSPRAAMSRDIPREYNIDLTVVGATGLNAMERVFIGSVSEAVVRRSLHDVLIIRAEEKQEDEDKESKAE